MILLLSGSLNLTTRLQISWGTEILWDLGPSDQVLTYICHLRGQENRQSLTTTLSHTALMSLVICHWEFVELCLRVCLPDLPSTIHRQAFDLLNRWAPPSLDHSRRKSSVRILVDRLLVFNNSDQDLPLKNQAIMVKYLHLVCSSILVNLHVLNLWLRLEHLFGSYLHDSLIHCRHL